VELKLVDGRFAFHALPLLELQTIIRERMDFDYLENAIYFPVVDLTLAALKRECPEQVELVDTKEKLREGTSSGVVAATLQCVNAVLQGESPCGLAAKNEMTICRYYEVLHEQLQIELSTRTVELLSENSNVSWSGNVYLNGESKGLFKKRRYVNEPDFYSRV
jgi:hypothetical protein